MRALSLLALTLATPLAAGDNLIVQSTTSTKNSGLYDYLLPILERETGINVRIVAVGTGQAIKNAERCDGDILLVHAKASEQAFVDAGYGTYRMDLMYNDFVIVGPDSDPARLETAESVSAAFRQIYQSGQKFASRGDDSGTHKKERSLWAAIGIDPELGSGDWYLETGSGMGATLNTGVGLNAYVMTDRATWTKFGNKQDYGIRFEGDPSLFNQYGIIPISPEHCPNVKQDAAETVVQWLVSEAGQMAIKNYRVAGRPLFFPNAN